MHLYSSWRNLPAGAELNRAVAERVGYRPLKIWVDPSENRGKEWRGYKWILAKGDFIRWGTKMHHRKAEVWEDVPNYSGSQDELFLLPLVRTRDRKDEFTVHPFENGYEVFIWDNAIGIPRSSRYFWHPDEQEMIVAFCYAWCDYFDRMMRVE